MTILEALGWQDVLSLQGGFINWVRAGYPTFNGTPPVNLHYKADPDQRLLSLFDQVLTNLPADKGAILPEQFIQALSENHEIFVIDVRRLEEIQAVGYIKDSIHLPLERFIALKTEWPPQKDAQILIYCGSGQRSTIAMTILWAYGYSDVHSLVGGLGG